MKILIFGKNGQLGWELQRSLSPLGEVLALDYKDKTTYCGDLSKLDELAKTIKTIAPDIVVNAAAYTAVDRAEIEIERAWLVNGTALEVISAEVAALGACLVHFSSDYVFSGEGKNPWKETGTPNPINYYGKSKLAGEEAIIKSGCNYLIFRTSWVYGLNGANFIKTILNLAKKRVTLNIVSDQKGVPTGADLIADLTAQILRIYEPKLSGIYHLVPRGQTSWFDYAKFLLDKAQNFGANFAVKTIVPLRSDDYPSQAKRPLNSSLDTTKIRQNFNIFLPDWEFGVERMIWQLLGTKI